MTKYISVLRGINVGGKRRILMKDLVKLYENSGYSNVIGYIQSGNVIFDSIGCENPAENSAKISNVIEDKYGYKVPVIVRTVQELKDAIDSNPFLGNNDVDIERLALTFLSETPADAKLAIINNYDYSPDRFVVAGKDVFLFIAGKYHKTRLSNQFFESKLELKASTRNWKTVLKIYELATKKSV